MANGNGTDHLDSSPLSKHIRPIIALLSFIVFSCLAAAVVMYVLKIGGQMEWVVAILGIFAACFLYYFNVRAQDKQLEKFMSLAGKLGGSWGQTPPKADSGTPTSGGASAVSTSSVAGTGATWGGNIPSGGGQAQYPIPEPDAVKPFNQAEFDAALVRSANSNVTWAKGWAENDPGIQAAVAYGVFTSLPSVGLVKDKLDYLKATTPYIEQWFKLAHFGDPNFDCGGVNCLAYAADQKTCNCGEDKTCTHTSDTMKQSKIRLTYCYDLRTKWNNIITGG